MIDKQQQIRDILHRLYQQASNEELVLILETPLEEWVFRSVLIAETHRRLLAVDNPRGGS